MATPGSHSRPRTKVRTRILRQMASQSTDSDDDLFLPVGHPKVLASFEGRFAADDLSPSTSPGVSGAVAQVWNNTLVRSEDVLGRHRPATSSGSAATSTKTRDVRVDSVRGSQVDGVSRTTDAADCDDDEGDDPSARASCRQPVEGNKEDLSAAASLLSVPPESAIRPPPPQTKTTTKTMTAARPRPSARCRLDSYNDDAGSLPGDRRSRSSSIVDDLLFQIYDRWHFGARDSLDSDTYTDISSMSDAHFISMNQIDSDQSRLTRAKLDHKEESELRQMRSEFQHRITQTSARLIRHLRTRERRLSRAHKHCDIITAILQASSLKRRIDSKIRFSIEPQPGEDAFNQWRDAMRAVARLPLGIPPEFRKKVWLGLAENHININIKLDWERTRRFAFNERSNPDDNKLGLQIVKDLHRTGCSGFSGSDNDEERAVLKRVLLAYARWNKRVGYCQGFNVLAALILDVMSKKEEDSLKVMIFLVDHVLPESYFANNLRALSVDMAVFRDLLRIQLPQLSAHLDRLQAAAKDDTTGANYEPPLTNVFTMQWFLTLFATCLPKEVALRVWDSVILEGSEILLRTAVAIWGELQPHILNVQSADEFYTTMASLTQEMLDNNIIGGDNLIKTVYSMGPLPFPQLSELREKYTYNITPFTAAMATGGRPGNKGGPNIFSDDDDFDDEDLMDNINCFTGIFPPSSPSKGRQLGESEKSQFGSNFDISKASPGAYAAQQYEAPETMAVAERMTLDIDMLKNQYRKLRSRQKQAHIILAAASAKHHARARTSSVAPIESPVAVNHLFLGRRAANKNSKKNRTIAEAPCIAPIFPSSSIFSSHLRPQAVASYMQQGQSSTRTNTSGRAERDHPAALREEWSDIQKSNLTKGNLYALNSSASSSTSTTTSSSRIESISDDSTCGPESHSDDTYSVGDLDTNDSVASDDEEYATTASTKQKSLGLDLIDFANASDHDAQDNSETEKEENSQDEDTAEEMFTKTPLPKSTTEQSASGEPEDNHSPSFGHKDKGNNRGWVETGSSQSSSKASSESGEQLPTDSVSAAMEGSHESVIQQDGGEYSGLNETKTDRPKREATINFGENGTLSQGMGFNRNDAQRKTNFPSSPQRTASPDAKPTLLQIASADDDDGEEELAALGEQPEDCVVLTTESVRAAHHKPHVHAKHRANGSGDPGRVGSNHMHHDGRSNTHHSSNNNNIPNNVSKVRPGDPVSEYVAALTYRSHKQKQSAASPNGVLPNGSAEPGDDADGYASSPLSSSNLPKVYNPFPSHHVNHRRSKVGIQLGLYSADSVPKLETGMMSANGPKSISRAHINACLHRQYMAEVREQAKTAKR